MGMLVIGTIMTMAPGSESFKRQSAEIAKIHNKQMYDKKQKEFNRIKQLEKEHALMENVIKKYHSERVSFLEFHGLSQNAADEIKDLLSKINFPYDTFIYCTGDIVSFEWDIEDNDISLTVDFTEKNRTGIFHVLRTNDGFSKCETIVLDSTDSWNDVIQKVESFRE